MAKSSSSSSNSENSGELLCVGTLEIATPKPVGFLCGSIPVPTDKSFHSFHSALLPTPQTVNAPRYRYRMLPTETDLNTPPVLANFQEKVLPVGAVHSKATAGDFPWESTSIASNFTRKCEALAVSGFVDYGDEIDIIAPADILKQIFKMPYSKARLSIAVHRIGDTLVLNTGPDIEEGEKLIRRHNNQSKCADQSLFLNFAMHSVRMEACDCPPTHHVPSEEQSNSSVFPGKTPHIVVQNDDVVQAEGYNCHSDYSQVGQDSLFWSSKKNRRNKSHSPVNKVSQVGEKSRSSMQESEKQRKVGNDNFLRVLFWQFHNFRMLLGSDLLLFSNEKYVAVSLHLWDVKRQGFSITKILLDIGGKFCSTSYSNHWVELVEIYSQVVTSINDASGRVLYESSACITVMLSKVTQVIRSSQISSSETLNKTANRIIEHAKTSGLIDHLCSCLATSGSGLIAGSSNMLRAASEACRAAWSLINALDVLFMRNSAILFPISALQSYFLQRTEIMDHRQDPLFDEESTKMVDVMTRAFLRSKSVQVAVYYCFHQRIESATICGLQLLSRCCLHSGIVPSALCGLPSSLPITTVVSGGGDGTIVSEIFSVLSICSSSLNKDSVEPNNTKCKFANPSALIRHSCAILTIIAQSLKSTGRNSAIFMLTTSPKKQLARLSVLAHHVSYDDKTKASFQLQSASAMLALASILSLESVTSVESSISEIAMPLIPRSSTLSDHLKFSSGNENELDHGNFNGKLPYWLGVKDGCVGLLDSKLKWGGPLAVQQLCASGIPLLLIGLLSNGFLNASQENESLNDKVGLSPIGVVCTVSSLCHCLSGGVLIFRQILIRIEHVKLISNLICDVHLKLIKFWTGPGGGRAGVRDLINAVIDLLAFPFVALQNAPGLPSATASVSSGFLLNAGSPGQRVCMEDKDTVKAIEEDMGKYIKILMEVGVPSIILRCLDHMELNDMGRPVAFLAKMVCQRPLAVQLVSKGLLDPNRMKRLFDLSGPKEVMLDALMIISDLSRMDKGFYEYIKGASVLEFLKSFLSHEDPNVRAKACSALGNMCRHSAFFYSSLARYQIVSILIDRCSDPDKRTRKFACFAIGNAAYHNDVLYEELRRSIPHLANLLEKAEEDKTKANAAGALSNLVRNSDRLCEDIVSKGAVQSLLKLISDYAASALSPSRNDSTNESPLKIALFSLAKMCAHPLCRQFIRSSPLFPVIGRLQQSPESSIAKYVSVIITKVAEP